MKHSSHPRILQVFGRLNRGGAEMRTVDLLRHLPPASGRIDFCSLSAEPGDLDAEVRAGCPIVSLSAESWFSPSIRSTVAFESIRRRSRSFESLQRLCLTTGRPRRCTVANRAFSQYTFRPHSFSAPDGPKPTDAYLDRSPRDAHFGQRGEFSDLGMVIDLARRSALPDDSQRPGYGCLPRIGLCGGCSKSIWLAGGLPHLDPRGADGTGEEPSARYSCR